MAGKQQDRTKLAMFLKTKDGYHLMGEGIQEQSMDYSANEDEVHFIHEKGARTNVEGYTISIPTPQLVYVGDPVFDFVDGLRRKRAIGKDAETEIIIAYPYLAEVGAKEVEAELNSCSISFSNFGGSAGETMQIEYDVKLSGDPQEGKATIDFEKGTATFAKTEA